MALLQDGNYGLAVFKHEVCKEIKINKLPSYPHSSCYLTKNPLIRPSGYSLRPETEKSELLQLCESCLCPRNLLYREISKYNLNCIVKPSFKKTKQTKNFVFLFKCLNRSLDFSSQILNLAFQISFYSGSYYNINPSISVLSILPLYHCAFDKHVFYQTK